MMRSIRQSCARYRAERGGAASPQRVVGRTIRSQRCRARRLAQPLDKALAGAGHLPVHLQVAGDRLGGTGADSAADDHDGLGQRAMELRRLQGPARAGAAAAGASAPARAPS